MANDLDPTTLRDVVVDISTLTLGEASEVERQSGRTISDLLKGNATRKLLAMFVHGSRTSDAPPSWSELSNLRLLDVSPSTSRSRQGETSQTSSD